MFNSLWSHGLQQASLPCPLLSSRVCSNSCPLSQWCHPTISSSVALFSSCPQSFPASVSFSMSRLFTSGGPSIGASASVFPMNIQDWFQHWLLWSPCSPRKSPEFSPTPQLISFNSLTLSLPHGPTLTSTHDYWKTHSFDNMDPCLASDFSAF